MYNDLKNDKVIVEINSLIADSFLDSRDDIDLYCEFMKERFLTLSSMN